MGNSDILSRSSDWLGGTIRIKQNVYSKRGILALIGGCLMLISFSIDFSYANLNTYVISYMRHEVNGNIDSADWIYFSTSKTLIQGLLMPIGGFVSNKLGVRLSLAIGSAFYSVGYMLTGWTISLNLPLAVLSLSVFHGIGFALVYSQTAGAVMAWFPNNPGFMAGICIGGYGFGSVIWNPLETFFVNPGNAPPISDPDGEDAYFEDEKVLERIPNLFFLLAGIFVVMQIVAILLLRSPREDEIQELRPIMPQESEAKTQTTFSVKPRQMLKTKEFYLMWVSFLAMNVINMFINNYQKSFGQIYIKDDSFFAIVATASSVTNGFSRILWGYAYDKQGFQFCMFIISSVSTALAFSFVNLSGIAFDSLGSRLFYGIWICTLYGVFPGMYATFAPSTRDIFGPMFFESNYGWLFTQNILNSLMMIGVTQSLFKVIGYNGMFLLTGGVGIVGMFASWLMPREISSEDFRGRFQSNPL